MFFILLSIFITSCKTLPTAIFHGFGDFCDNPIMEKFTKDIGTQISDYSVCIEVGSGVGSSITMDFKEQAKQACENLQNDSNLNQKKINLVGLSQGALLARYIIEDCEFGGKVQNFLSIGGPHMGVSALPHCEDNILCYPINTLTRSLVYSDLVQKHIGPAGYYKDVSQIKKYLEKCSLLPDINNERNPSQSRKQRFKSLNRLMLIKFTKDTMITPKETAWFQSWDENHNIIQLEDSEFYQNDNIGLRTLNEQKKIDWIEIDGDHLQFSDDDMKQIFIPFLQNKITKK